MSTRKDKITVSSFEIEVVRKNIKNMHLAVYPPDGRIRLAVPNDTNEDRETERTYVSGESHYFMGRRYLLKIIEHDGHSKVLIDGTRRILLYAKSNATKEQKATVLKEWYRKQLKKEIPVLLEKWEKVTGVKANAWGVKQMKTKWGACNTESKRVWLNLELARKPKICLEYIIVHELVHLLERNHTEKFIQYMDQFMPKWRQHRDELNSLPIKHEDWEH